MSIHDFLLITDRNLTFEASAIIVIMSQIDSSLKKTVRMWALLCVKREGPTAMVLSLPHRWVKNWALESITSCVMTHKDDR